MAEDHEHEKTRTRPDPAIGLCARCAHVRVQGTKRGAKFYRCARADEDDTFMQYPPLPLVDCRGYTKAS